MWYVSLPQSNWPIRLRRFVFRKDLVLRKERECMVAIMLSIHTKGTFLCGFHMQTRITEQLGLNQNDYTFTLTLLIKMVLCSKFPWNMLMHQECFEMRCVRNERERRTAGTRLALGRNDASCYRTKRMNSMVVFKSIDQPNRQLDFTFPFH